MLASYAGCEHGTNSPRLYRSRDGPTPGSCRCSAIRRRDCDGTRKLSVARLNEFSGNPTFSVRPVMDISRSLIVLGLTILAVGILWPMLTKLGLGRLPGDIAIERHNFRFYFPLMTSILLSLVFSVVLWLVD